VSSTRMRPALVVLGAAALLTASVAVPQASAASVRRRPSPGTTPPPRPSRRPGRVAADAARVRTGGPVRQSSGQAVPAQNAEPVPARASACIGLRAVCRRPRGAAGVRRRGERGAQRPPDRDPAFWLGLSLTLCTEPLRVALSRTDQGIAGQARLVALFHVALVDTQIATSDSKYAYERWCPVTAIRTGTIDPDPDWTPLHTTPAHPDYPSGHNTYAGAAQTVLSALVGPRTAPFDLTSPTAPGVTRTYTAWKQLSDENVDARSSPVSTPGRPTRRDHARHERGTVRPAERKPVDLQDSPASTSGPGWLVQGVHRDRIPEQHVLAQRSEAKPFRHPHRGGVPRTNHRDEEVHVQGCEPHARHARAASVA